MSQTLRMLLLSLWISLFNKDQHETSSVFVQKKTWKHLCHELHYILEVVPVLLNVYTEHQTYHELIVEVELLFRRLVHEDGLCLGTSHQSVQYLHYVFEPN